MANSYSKSRLNFSRFALPIGFFILTLLYRAPDRVTILYDWDNIQYLLALNNFDILAHQPHPPGNPLFVFSSWLIRLIVLDGQLAMWLLSACLFAIGAALVYHLGLKLFDMATGFGAAIIFIVSPLGGFFVSYPNTYAIEAAFAASFLLIVSDWLIIQPSDAPKSNTPPWLLPWALGLFAGFRMTFFWFALPLALYAMYSNRRLPWIKFTFHLIAAVLVWLIPMLIMTGGLNKYLLAFQAEAGPFVRPLAIDNILANLDIFRKSEFGGLGYFAILPVIYSLGAGFSILVKIKNKPRETTHSLNQTALLVLLWIVPAFLFMTKNLTHPGYLMFFMPLAAIGLVRCLIWIASIITLGRKPMSKFVTAILIICVSLTLMNHWTGRNNEFFSMASIRNSEDRVDAFITAIRENFPSDKTVIVSMEHFRQVQIYLPESHAVFPQAAYAYEFGTNLARANLYYAHMGKVHPEAWHLIRTEPVSPIVLPDDIEFIVVSPGDFNRLENQDGFSSGTTSTGEQFLYRSINGISAIAMDGNWWVIASLAPG